MRVINPSIYSFSKKKKKKSSHKITLDGRGSYPKGYISREAFNADRKNNQEMRQISIQVANGEASWKDFFFFFHQGSKRSQKFSPQKLIRWHGIWYQATKCLCQNAP